MLATGNKRPHADVPRANCSKAHIFIIYFGFLPFYLISISLTILSCSPPPCLCASRAVSGDDASNLPCLVWPAYIDVFAHIERCLAAAGCMLRRSCSVYGVDMVQFLHRLRDERCLVCCASHLRGTLQWWFASMEAVPRVNSFIDLIRIEISNLPMSYCSLPLLTRSF